jgi:anaerobic magnesium-protoporphyrin IX monomethyl ester cyclase
MVAEAQFIIGMENETPETIEETYKWAMDWKCDMANWNMYTPWPFSDLFEELGDKVEVRDYARYNFVTPIMKPEAMTRERGAQRGDEELRPLLHAEGLLQLPVAQGQVQAEVHAGLPEGVLKSGFERRFYDLGRIGYRGQKNVDFKFDKENLPEEEDAMA